MAISPRIDELEKKFNENPRRYFAPLANEYRKAGDVERAIEICRAYLPSQPAHMSGHIVFGQALFEARLLDEARQVFETALTLDPENLIALRHLGDIAREGGDIAAARQWYQRVLEADPRSEEIAAVITELDAAAPPAAAPAASASAPAAAPSGATGWGEVNPEHAAPPPSATPPGAPISGAPLQLRESLSVPVVPDPTAAAAGAAASSPAPSAADAPPPLAAIVYAPIVTDEQRAAADPTRSPAGASGAAELGLEPMEFIAPTHVGEAAPTAPRGEAVVESAFITETMAELYLQQGFVTEALGVYKELLAQSPSDAGLRQRVEQLERGARSSVEAAAVSESVIESARERRAARPVQTARSFFGSLAGRRAPRDAWGADGADAGQPPAPHASDALPYLVEPDEVASPERPDAGDATAASEAPPASPRSVWHAEETPALASEEPGPAPVAAPADADAGKSGGHPIAGHAPAGEEEPPVAWWSPESNPPAGASTEGPEGDGVDDRAAAPAAQGDAIGELFAGASSPEDEAAAKRLSGAFDAVNGTEDGNTTRGTTPPSGRPSTRAPAELSLDTVFREADRRTPAPARDTNFSFDQFFSDRAAKRTPEVPPPAAPAPVPAAPTPVTGGAEASADDVEQFNAWLTGLKKK